MRKEKQKVINIISLPIVVYVMMKYLSERVHGRSTRTYPMYSNSTSSSLPWVLYYLLISGGKNGGGFLKNLTLRISAINMGSWL